VNRGEDVNAATIEAVVRQVAERLLKEMGK
jgi:hypothetical protein